MGFDPKLYRPEDLILKTFPIHPISIRPSLRADYLASQTYEDDLTHKLADIIKTNKKLRKQLEKESPDSELSRYADDLRNYLYKYLKNNNIEITDTGIILNIFIDVCDKLIEKILEKYLDNIINDLNLQEILQDNVIYNQNTINYLKKLKSPKKKQLILELDLILIT